eukprot:2981092-Prymnesium_polylepis.1
MPSEHVRSEHESQRQRLRRLGGPKDYVRACANKWRLRVRELHWKAHDRENESVPSEKEQSDRESLRKRLRDRMRAAYFDRQRVLVCCATPSEARE